MIIGGFQPVSLCDYPNTPAAVIFLQGCNLRCPFCHNQQLLPLQTMDTGYTEEEILTHLKARQQMVSAVVITGGEPTIHNDLSRFIKLLKTLGFKVKLDTNGTNPTMLGQLIEQNILDHIAMDIKAPWAKYDVLSGVPIQKEMIRESIRLIESSLVPYHFRTTFVPHLLNDDDVADIKAIIHEQSHYVVQKYIAVDQEVPPQI